MQVIHPLEPIYDANSKVLILGTMPSLKSRELKFYYANPQNRFWKVLEMVYEEKIGNTIDEKIAFLHSHHIALFDVLKSCEINGSQDNSIKNPVPNDLLPILNNSKIETIFTTGKKAYELYNKYIYPNLLIEAIPLPSTSPANSPKGILNILLEEYGKIKEKTN